MEFTNCNTRETKKITMKYNILTLLSVVIILSFDLFFGRWY